MNLRAKRRARLFKKQRGKCHWCGCQCVNRNKPPDQPHRKNDATLDHLDDRLSGRRGEFQNAMIERTVMACYSCNQRRGFEAVQAFDRDEMRRRCAQQAVCR